MTEQDQIRALGRDAARRGVIATVAACLVLVGLGALLIYLGITFEEPAERIATRSVPRIAPIALCIAGAMISVAGVVLVIRGLWRVRRRR